MGRDNKGKGKDENGWKWDEKKKNNPIERGRCLDHKIKHCNDIK